MLDEREAAAWRARITAAAPTPTPTMTVTSNSLRIVPVGAALEADPVALLHARIANATPDEVDTLAEQLVDLGVRLVEAAERVRGRR
jgi:hypothetical protein